MRIRRPLPITLLLLSAAAPLFASEPFGFEVAFSPKVRSEPFTGRVIVFLSSKDVGQPRQGHGWTSREPIFGQDVRDWKPGTPLRITHPVGFPCDLKDLPKGKYRVQAVMHTNPDEPHSGTAVGNLFSKPVSAELDPAAGGLVKLEIARKVKPRKEDDEQDRVKAVRIRSRLLSDFHKRDVFLRARVILPEEYEKEPDQRFPALYVIPGFGGDLRQTGMYAMILGQTKTPFVRIALDAMCGTGHHVFADSDNNGPWGTALVEELIPYLEKHYRLIPEPRARLLTGHSSGGWSSLWLQVSHPEFFGGTWSTSPDSMDFHDFCGIDLYDPKTDFYTSSDGEPRPIMRQNGEVKLLLRDFVRMEDALGPGGQIGSFEAVFGPRGKNGRPVPLFDRKSGRIDPKVLAAWRRYDIVEKLRREWPEIGPKLAGKVTVIVGDADNFYLEGASKRLQAALAELGSDGRVIIEPGRDHGTIMGAKSFRRMVDEMSERFQESEKPHTGS